MKKNEVQKKISQRAASYMLNFQFVGVLVLNSFHENVPKHSIVIVNFIWKLTLPVVTKRFLLISIPN